MPVDPFSLAGKTILVTGASSGIGREVARACAERGAKVVVSGRNRERLGETLVGCAGGDHRAVIADLTDPQQVNALADAAGEIDGLFFSAGIATIDSKYIPPTITTRRFQRSGNDQADVASTYAAATTTCPNWRSGARR